MTVLEKACVTEVRKYLSVCDRLASAGQPTLEQFAAIREAGFEVIVNLLPEERAEPGEEQTVRALGMAYAHIPVVWAAPRAEDVRRFFAAMDDHAGRKVFVHCAVNMRASAFLYLYRVCRLGVDPDDAEADLHDMWVPDGCWAALINEVLTAHEVPALTK
jgi:protein tyrosine phosphatase (PTP) superfamily phosphohydrolase (DUF442 family)